MNYRWKPSTPQLAAFISVVGLLILLSVNDTQPARAQATLPSFTLVSNAVLHENRLGLTVIEPLQTGAAWLPTKQQVQDGFEAQFQWQITRISQRGTDGFAFVIHNALLPFPGIAVGEGRPGLGYQGIPNSLAVEFDTEQNSAADFGAGTLGDPNDNHISVQTRGTETNNANTDFSLGYTTQGTPTIPLFADGSVHTTKVVYKPGDQGNPGNIAIYLDNMERPILNAHVNLAELLSLDEGQAWVGFTGATGKHAQAHDIHSFSFVGFVGAQATQP
jgi:peptide-N4-(N-acetyl-beta-glucosaminyl)asparagine amidase